MRLIDAECLCDLVEQSSILSAGFKQVFEKLVAGEPTVDAVPVIRCRECRYYAASGATTSFCIHPGGMKFTSDSDYCSRGERHSNQFENVKSKVLPSKVRILADCIERMAADAEYKGKDSFGIHLSLEDARMITRSLSAASQSAGGGAGE